MAILRDVVFLVSPARHGEAQNVSETSNNKTNQNKTKQNSKNRGDFRDYAKAPNTVKTPVTTAFK
jgi:hypothetical protein